jgi:hypothetical protein
VVVAGADEASEEDGDVAGDSESGEIGASEHVSTVTLFPDFPDQSAFPTQREVACSVTVLQGWCGCALMASRWL